MRLLPKKRSQSQNLIIWGTFDYYGTGMNKKDIIDARNVALFIMNRKKWLTPLTEEQKSDVNAIKENLKDELYINNLTQSPPRTP